MSARLPRGGLLIDRQFPVSFRADGRKLSGYRGDTLASALMGAGEMLMGRSFKYHRPRGPVASGPEEPNALYGIGSGARFEPNQRATVTELFEGLEARSQNRWPSLAFDVGAVNAKLSRLLPAGFYYKTFIHPRAAWKHLFEPVIRRSAGLGRPPREPDADRYEQVHAFFDVMVVGGGIAGLAAARQAAAGGARVMLVEQAAHWGGRALVDGPEIDGLPAADWVAAEVAALAARGNVTLRSRFAAAAVNDHGYVLGVERLTDHAPGAEAPRQRLWRIRAGRVVTATGAIERPLSFPGNDVPGVMLASAIRDHLALYAVSPGARTVLLTNNDDGYRTAIALKKAGLDVPAIVDVRANPSSQLVADARALGLRVEFGRALSGVKGVKRVEAVQLCALAGQGSVIEEIACDAVAMSGGWSPVVHLWSHSGGKLGWDEANAMFIPDPDRPPTGADGAGFVLAAGTAAGKLLTGEVLADAAAIGRRAAEEVGQRPGDEAVPRADSTAEAPLLPVWIMPLHAGPELRARAFLDYQNDVKVSDVQLAAREGYESVEHTKRYTTLGMATDQGKLSNINGLAVLADTLGQPIPQVGTTTFRPPYTPVSFGAITGMARGPLFRPVRRTTTDPWAEAVGAVFEPVGDWRRVYACPRAGESTEDAVVREVLTVREAVGVLDASTLGKIIVKGPDAGKLLDLVYTNVMSTLKPGRCRYGLMCTENGFVFDDGVVVRLDAGTFLCHTTTGGAERVHGHLEEWLQTEWWDLQVYTANVTEQFAQFVVAGPKARGVLEALGGMDVSREGLPFLSSAEGVLGGFPVRVHRISFSGELSFEVAVPAARGAELWERLIGLGAVPYGTEAMHVLRAEKGFIIVGDETDGTVTPHDLGMSWAVSKKKPDFIGKRGLERSYLVGAGRKQLVGLETVDPSDQLPDGAHATSGTRPDGRPRAIGHVTSTYRSPTLGRPIALGLIEDGLARMGEVIDFPVSSSLTMHARIVSPCFFDKEGSRQDV
ncbi:sarcosine oxidase subunit alpha family protein [Oceanicella sp. SM1341]|uniref:sarcosine oxidase subunit alpha family protein n=1 Tax=Oceanicella sp. SM1341 TaxID=1548889 RepID=UPI000E525F62|nr:sarcosine oxidase subunit alpha family protein [Oceanicella sp. SM1341]